MKLMRLCFSLLVIPCIIITEYANATSLEIPIVREKRCICPQYSCQCVPVVLTLQMSCSCPVVSSPCSCPTTPSIPQIPSTNQCQNQCTDVCQRQCVAGQCVPVCWNACNNAC